MPSIAQIKLKKAGMKNEFRYAKQHLWQYEYDYKCNRYSLMTTTVPVKQLHVTSQDWAKNILEFCCWNFN